MFLKTPMAVEQLFTAISVSSLQYLCYSTTTIFMVPNHPAVDQAVWVHKEAPDWEEAS